MSHIHNFPGPSNCTDCRVKRVEIELDWQLVLDGKLSTDEFVDRHQEQLYEKHMSEMPYGTAKARDGDPTEWLYEHYDREFMEQRDAARWMRDTV